MNIWKSVPNGTYSVKEYEVNGVTCDAVIVNNDGVWAARYNDGVAEHIEENGEYVAAPLRAYVHYQYGKASDGFWFIEQWAFEHLTRSWFANGTEAYKFVRRLNKGERCEVIKIAPPKKSAVNNWTDGCTTVNSPSRPAGEGWFPVFSVSRVRGDSYSPYTNGSTEWKAAANKGLASCAQANFEKRC